MAFTIDDLNLAFDVAERETAEQYESQTCAMVDRHGVDSCPICFFRQQVKNYLKTEEDNGKVVDDSSKIPAIS